MLPEGWPLAPEQLAGATCPVISGQILGIQQLGHSCLPSQPFLTGYLMHLLFHRDTLLGSTLLPRDQSF